MSFSRFLSCCHRGFWPVLCVGWCLATGRTLAQQAPPTVPTLAAGNASLDAWLTAPTLWQTTPETFGASVRGDGFRWVSQTHDAARASNPALRLHDLPVAEVIARFSPGSAAVPTGSPGVAPAPATLAAAGGQTRLATIQISIYNRGDAGDLDQKAFEALVERSKAALSALTHVAPVERGADNGSAVQSRGLVWTAFGSRYLLEWSATPENKVQGVEYRAEFVRLRVAPFQDQGKGFFAEKRAEEAAATGRAQPATIHASALPARVVKNPDGSRQLAGIPMVDQGQKGYCVTASTERVLRYYGVDVDQNELAQIATRRRTAARASTKWSRRSGSWAAGSRSTWSRKSTLPTRTFCARSTLQPRGALRQGARGGPHQHPGGQPVVRNGL